MKKVLDVLDRLFHYLAAIGFGCVTVCVLVQILARYIPGVTAPWTDEMTRLFFPVYDHDCLPHGHQVP